MGIFGSSAIDELAGKLSQMGSSHLIGLVRPDLHRRDPVADAEARALAARVRDKHGESGIAKARQRAESDVIVSEARGNPAQWASIQTFFDSLLQP